MVRFLFHWISRSFYHVVDIKWTASSEFGTYRLCEQRRFRRACASAQSRQNLRWSLIQAVSQEEPSDRKPGPWPLWMAGHAQLKFVMTECSKTQIRLTGLKLNTDCLYQTISIFYTSIVQYDFYFVSGSVGPARLLLKYPVHFTVALQQLVHIANMKYGFLYLL